MPLNYRLAELLKHGQSIWLDSIRRKSLLDGEMEDLIEQGVRGETANPTIFEKALSTSDYDDEVRALVAQGKGVEEIYETLLVEDVQRACDLFRVLYEASDGADGFVSLEVSPRLARDTQGTMQEVRRFWRWVNRPNLMIKIPGTAEGVPAIEQMLYEGVNINITLLFAIEAYEQVARAYIHALERRVAEGKDVHRLASVASFFVSRIDTYVDKLLDQKIKATSDPLHFEELKELQGKAAIANAKLAYASFKQIFDGDLFRPLAERGARMQRPLWASTSTKNPAYRDTMYVEGLIGPHTINTLPVETIHAFMDHGRVERTVDDKVEQARETIQALEARGIRMEDVTRQVLDEGVVKFAESLDQLMDCLEAKRAAMSGERATNERMNLATYQRDVDWRLAEWIGKESLRKLWTKDSSLWSSDENIEKAVKNRLGWLNVSQDMLAHVGELRSFAEEAKRDGFTDAVLCGMGGSSLGVEVLQKTFNDRAGFFKLHVLDTTDPVTISNLTRELNSSKTLFIIASKSGTTIETNAHFKFFWKRVPDGRNFVAITDSGTLLESLANEHEFRHVFVNPADIGGRYSVLSYFGLVCGALLGVDLELLLTRANEIRRTCSACVNSKENPGLWLGVILGELALQRRDKMTIVTSAAIRSFGAWAEQLIAESTGKLGKGIVPIFDEPLAIPDAYSDDRVFIYLKLTDAVDPDTDAKLTALERAGHPVLRLHLADPYDLGAEFFRWEFATAVASAMIGVNPFDEPNVTESKENTQRVLKEEAEMGRTPRAGRVFLLHEKLRGGEAEWRRIGEELLRLARGGDYFAVMAYLTQTDANDRALERIRLAVRRHTKLATTVGYGPRFLHSTGQLHKGGANNVLALLITTDRATDEAIPGEAYSFGELLRAQAIGDWQSLERHNRRAVRVHLANENELAGLAHAIERVLMGDLPPKKAERSPRRLKARVMRAK